MIKKNKNQLLIFKALVVVSIVFAFMSIVSASDIRISSLYFLDDHVKAGDEAELFIKLYNDFNYLLKASKK